MSDHTTAYVPIESWCYASPDVRYDKKIVDIGLLAESLLYYEQVHFSLSSQPQFAELITWFLRQDAEHEFTELLNEGTIRVYHHCFASVPIQAQDGSYSIWNMEDELQKLRNISPGTFFNMWPLTKHWNLQKTSRPF